MYEYSVTQNKVALRMLLVRIIGLQQHFVWEGKCHEKFPLFFEPFILMTRSPIELSWTAKYADDWFLKMRCWLWAPS